MICIRPFDIGCLALTPLSCITVYVIMSTTASQITSVSIVYSTVCSGVGQRIPTQRASNAENVSIWWRQNGSIPVSAPDNLDGFFFSMYTQVIFLRTGPVRHCTVCRIDHFPLLKAWIHFKILPGSYRAERWALMARERCELVKFVSPLHRAEINGCANSLCQFPPGVSPLPTESYDDFYHTIFR